MGAQEQILNLMRERVEATRPQLAAASGLSLVSVNKAVSALCLQGVLRLKGTIPSAGGRPVQLYCYNRSHALTALFSVQPEQGFWRGTLHLCDMTGKEQRREEARFSLIQAGSLDDWLDAATRRRRLSAVGLCLPPELPETGLAPHLQQRYACSVSEVNAAMGFIGAREGTLALYLPRNRPPQGCLRRNGNITPCPALHLLPLPAEWSELDYDDRTLVEEMVSRLLQMLTATLAPARCELYADFWTERLRTRIVYNLSAKLRGYERAPRLSFHQRSAEQAAAVLFRTLPR